MSERVGEAWTNPGPVPEYHRDWQQRLRREWPALASALDALDAPEPDTRAEVGAAVAVARAEERVKFRKHVISDPDLRDLHENAKAYSLANTALHEKYGFTHSTTLAWLIEQGHIAPTDPAYTSTPDGTEPATWCRVFRVGPPCPHPCASCKATDALLTPEERERILTPKPDTRAEPGMVTSLRVAVAVGPGCYNVEGWHGAATRALAALDTDPAPAVAEGTDVEALAEALENGMEQHAIAHRNSNSPYGHVCDRDDRINTFKMLIRAHLAQRDATRGGQ